MSRFPVRDVTSRTPGPSVHASGDGLEGSYSAVVHAAPSGGTCKVVIPALGLLNYYTAHCSSTFTASAGNAVLVTFDENKDPWVVTPTAITKINGVTVPLTTSAWIAPSPINSWVTSSTVGYLKDPLGFVRLRGSMQTGTSGTTAFTLPAGFRPGVADFWPALQSGGVAGAYVHVDTTGNVAPTYTGAPVWLNAVSFLAEN